MGVTNHDCARFEVWAWGKMKARGFPENYPERWTLEPHVSCEYGHEMTIPQILMDRVGPPVCLIEDHEDACNGSLSYNMMLDLFVKTKSWPDIDKAIEEYWEARCQT